MRTQIEVIENNTYIFKGRRIGDSKNYSKCKILEVTDTTYLIKNIDTQSEFRCGIVDLFREYELVEHLTNKL
jgi:hypothetical protein